MSNSTSYQFDVGELIFVVVRQLMYKAKVLRRRQSTQNQYFIHYLGWKKCFDCWVDEDASYEDCESIRKQKIKWDQELKGAVEKEQAEIQEQKDEAKRIKMERRAEAIRIERERKAEVARKERERKAEAKRIERERKVEARRIEMERKVEARRIAKKRKIRSKRIVTVKKRALMTALPLKWPLLIKRMCVYDRNQITKANLLPTLPRKICVSTILDDYASHVEQNKYLNSRGNLKAHELAVVFAIRDLFNELATLGGILYAPEKEAYRKFPCPKEPSRYYGIEHLVRLLLKLPYLFLSSVTDEKLNAYDRKNYAATCNRMMKWLCRHRSFRKGSYFDPKVTPVCDSKAEAE